MYEIATNGTWNDNYKKDTKQIELTTCRNYIEITRKSQLNFYCYRMWFSMTHVSANLAIFR
jgi:hypothetical protein